MSDDALIIDLEKDLIDGAADKIRQTFRVAQPARVESPYRATSRVDVTFPVRWYATNITIQQDPPAPALPVMFTRGGGYGFYFDVAQGDLGIALACDGPPSGLYDTGDDVTPQFAQGHDYGCAVFYPAGRVSNQETPTDPPNPTGTCTIGSDDASAQVEFRRAGGPSPDELGTIILSAAGALASILLGGSTAAIPVACATQVFANLTDLNTRIQAWVPVPNDGGASLKPIIAAWFAALQDMADAKARVEGPTP